MGFASWLGDSESENFFKAWSCKLPRTSVIKEEKRKRERRGRGL